MNKLPIEIQNYIWNMYYKDIYSNNVIKELNEYNKKILEYEYQEYIDWLYEEWEYRAHRISWPYLLKNIN